MAAIGLACMGLRWSTSFGAPPPIWTGSSRVRSRPTCPWSGRRSSRWSSRSRPPRLSGWRSPAGQGDRQPESLGGLGLDDHLELRRPLHGQVGILGYGTGVLSHPLKAFRESLAEFGYVEGQN